MRPDDLALLRTPGTPAVAPDGRIAVVAVTRLDPGSGGPRSQLWAVPTDASAPARPLTTGGRDTDPAFSPDGRWLAYLGAAGDEPPQVHLLPTAGGAPRRLTDAPLGAGPPVWSPDSRRLAWTAPPGPAADPTAPRLITSLRFRVDGAGVVGDRHDRVHVLDLPDDLAPDDAPLPEPAVVPSGDAHCTGVRWSPDGAELAFVSARHAAAGRDGCTDVFAVRPDGSGLRRVTGARARYAGPAYAPDGTALVVTALPAGDADGGATDAGDADAGPVPGLYRVPAGGGMPEPLPGVPAGGEVLAGAVPTARGLLVRVRRAGAVELLRVPLSGGAAEVLVDGPFTVSGAGAGGGVVVATVGHDGSAGELIAISPGRRRLLTAFGAGLGATGRVHRATELALPGPAPAGRVTRPAGPGPHPVVLAISDEPPTWELVDAVQAAVTAGLAVVQCGPADPDAVLAVLDAALADPGLQLDRDRVGVDGGTVAALLAGHAGRFTAAVVEAVGELEAAQLAALAIPTLVVHGEQDLHRPAEQGVRLYTALRGRGIPAELLLVPGEGNGLPRSGRYGNRAARLEHRLRWWRRWLRPDADRAPGRPGH